MEVRLRDGESQESLLKRFQRSVQMSGVLREFKAGRFFVSRGEAERIKAKSSAKRRRKEGGPRRADK